MARLAKASVPYRYPVLGLEGGVPTWLGGSSVKRLIGTPP